MKASVFIIAVVLALALTGCAQSRYLRGDVDGLIEEVGASQVNGLIVEEQSGKSFVQTYGRGGGNRRFFELDELDRVVVAHGGILEVRIHALPEHAGTVERMFTDRQRAALGDRVVRAMSRYVESFPALGDLAIRLDVVMALENSGVSVAHRSEIAESVKIVLVNSVNEDSELPAVYWWADVASTAVHELLHLNFDLAPARHGRVNEEAAASLLEVCLNSDIAIETQSGLGFQSDILEARNQRFFPAIDRGAFRPASHELATLPHASIQGSSLANALIYLEAGRDAFLFRDTAALETLKQACLGFGKAVPDFLAGERPWRHQGGNPGRIGRIGHPSLMSAE